LVIRQRAGLVVDGSLLALADRFGTARTVGAGGALYVAGMLMIATATEGVMLTVGNALSGVGMAAAGFGPILGAIGRQTPIEWRSSALGIATAGGSFGQFAIVPFASILQSSLDNWHSTMFVLAAVSVTMVPLALGLREHRAVPAKGGCFAASKQHGRVARSVSHAGLLIAHNRLLCLRLPCDIYRLAPALLCIRSLDRPVVLRTPISAIELGGWAIGLVGLFNIIGTLLWGWLGGHHLRKDMLALLYALRALAFVLFLAIPLSWMSVLAFAASLGFLWLGTVPLTSGLVAYMFGTTHMSMLWGIVFFSHQLGSFLGGWGVSRNASSFSFS
jgi:MFS family permease